MGDPRKIKNKYKTPIHPWEKIRLEVERPLMKQYGLTNKKELWKFDSKIKNFKDSAKRLVASSSDQAVLERKQMFDKLRSYGLINSEALDDVLGLGVESMLDRRLQTIVFKKGFARSIKQARQMITHKHIIVNGRKVTAPSYLVRLSEEDSVSFYPSSNFSSDDHPERVILTKNVKVESVKESKDSVEKPKKVEKLKEEPQIEKTEEKVVEKPKKEEVTEIEATKLESTKEELTESELEVEPTIISTDVEESKNKEVSKDA